MSLSLHAAAENDPSYLRRLPTGPLPSAQLLPGQCRPAVPQDKPDLHAALLPPGTRPIWRSATSVQFGLDPARAVVVDGVDEQTVRLIVGLDGSRSQAEVQAEAAAKGLDEVAVGWLLGELRRTGVLATPGPAGVPTTAARYPSAPSPARSTSGAGGARDAEPTEGRPAERLESGPDAAGAVAVARSPGVLRRLAPDRASLSLLTGPLAADMVLARRRAAAVVVHGANRVGVSLAGLLAAAGVGGVHVVDRGRVRPSELAPGGLSASDAHRPRAAAAADAVRRGAPEADTRPPPPRRLPDLVVMASTRPVDVDLRAALHGAQVAHLVAGVRETTAIVGPLVLPGATACLRCADLHRAERDPSWPVMAAQLAGQRPGSGEACDVALASLAAAVGALQCLAYLDGGSPASHEGTLELTLPDWRMRRRSWPPHRSCGCGAAQVSQHHG